MAQKLRVMFVNQAQPDDAVNVSLVVQRDVKPDAEGRVEGRVVVENLLKWFRAAALRVGTQLLESDVSTGFSTQKSGRARKCWWRS